jgi:hypothetical protein
MISTFWALHDIEYSCFHCKKKYSETVRDQKKACFTEKRSPIVEYQKKIKFTLCPSNQYNPACASIIDSFSLFQSGVLPFEGGLFDQPSKIVDLYNLVASLRVELQKDFDKKAKSWQMTKSKLNSPSRSKKP